MERRIDIIFGCKTKHYKTWSEIVKAVRTGETLIKTCMSSSEVRKNVNKYDKDGRCITVGCYTNWFCDQIRSLGIKDIRYGSTNGWHYGLSEGTYSDSYTIYPPQGWKPWRIIQ